MYVVGSSRVGSSIYVKMLAPGPGNGIVFCLSIMYRENASLASKSRTNNES